MIVAVIAEGPGDLLAVPRLLSLTGGLIGENIISANPIRSQGFHILKRPNGLEKFVEMAVRRDGVDLVLVVVDLDDDCAMEEAEKFNTRIEAMAIPAGKRVRVCFLVKEFECLFLADIDGLRLSAPEYGWDPAYTCLDPESHRSAKGLINRAMSKHYKEMIDQPKLTSKLDPRRLYNNSRSYRKLLRCLTDLEYHELSELIG